MYMSNSICKSSDSTLVKKYIKGDEESLSILIDRHKLKLYNFIYSKVFDHEVAEDIFQDTFIKIIRNLRNGAYEEKGKFLPWIMRVSHNLIIDYFRKGNKIPTFEIKDELDVFQLIGDDEPNIEKSMIDQQVVNDLRKLIDELPSNQSEVLRMRLYKDMSFKEISENTGVSINTALGRMRYALINLRKLIEDNQIILSA